MPEKLKNYRSARGKIASANNIRGQRKPQKENLLEGLTNLDTGESADGIPLTSYPSMKAAAHALKIDIGILKDARAKACSAFNGSGAVHRERLLLWLKNNARHALEGTPPPDQSQDNQDPDTQDEFVDNYNIPDEAGGVGQTLKSLQAYERRLKQILDKLERSTNLHPSVKADKVKQAQDAWLKVVNSLLKYDLAVDMAKRESGELLPMADAIKAVQALLAWHTVGTSDALRNAIPECEGKTKYEIAAILDPVLRSAIYRNFKLGVKIGKIPEWMAKTATDFMVKEKPLDLEDKKGSTNLDDY